MKKTMIFASLLALAPFVKGQLLLEALEGEIPNEKCLERVKDKYYGDGDHNFIYCAVMGPGNKKWLNLNLGAEYAREGSEYFNPEAVPTNNLDWKAFGSLYNFNRDSDRHELVQYKKGIYWEVKHKNGYTTNRPTAGEKSNIVATEPSNIRVWELDNDPCPEGYQLITANELRNTVGYSFQGLYYSTGVVKHPDYINWNLMLAPVWGKEREYFRETPTEGYKGTHTLYDSVLLSYGTSGVWLAKADLTRRNRLTREQSPIGGFYNNGTWSTEVGDDDNGQYLDYGIWKSDGEFMGAIGFGYPHDYAAMAVRCIEK